MEQESKKLLDDKIPQFLCLLIIGLLSFIFFPNREIIYALIIILSAFLVIQNKDGFQHKKRMIPYALFLIIYLISMGVSSYNQGKGISLLSVIYLLITTFSCFIIGYTMKENEKVQFYDVIYSFLILTVVFAIFLTLYAYGAFYVYRYSSVAGSAKMLLGFKVYEVKKDVLGYLLVLGASPTCALIQYSKEKNTSFYILLASTVLSFIGLFIMPHLVGIFIALIGVMITLLIRFFPQEKKKRIALLSIIGVILISAIGFILIKGMKIARIQLIIKIIQNAFIHPFGTSVDDAQTLLNGAEGSRNLFFDALYQGGFIPFIALIGLWVCIGILLFKYYKNSKDNITKKTIILSFYIHYFIYVNLNYTQTIFAQYRNILPYYQDPTFLLILVLTGYIFRRANEIVKPSSNEEIVAAD